MLNNSLNLQNIHSILALSFYKIVCTSKPVDLSTENNLSLLLAPLTRSISRFLIPSTLAKKSLKPSLASPLIGAS